jgi:prophage antirepressor-like protein
MAEPASNIVPFQFETREIRVVMRDGEPWWALRDVCGTLEIANASDAAGRLEDDEKGVVLTDTPGGAQKITVVSEPGLYRLIMRSDKPIAKRFQRWVFHEVLPEIRKTGSYSATKEKLPTNFDAIRALVDAAEEHETRLKKVEGAVENFGAHEDFKSIKAYAALTGRKITTKESGELGRLATAISKQDGYKVGKQPDESFGLVNTYHRDVLERIFSND